MKHVVVERRRQGAPLLLLPGAGSDAGCWEGLARMVAGSFELHLAEIAGFAERPRAPGPLWPAVRDELVAYVRELAEPPLVVGHSWGGFVAWSLLVSGAAVRGVVVVDSMPALGALIASDSDLASVVARRGAELRAFSPEELGRRLEPSIRSMTRTPEQAERVLGVAARSDPRAIADAMEAAWLADLRPALAAHHGAPVRLVLPGDEHLTSSVRVRKHGLARAQVAGLPQHRVVEVADAGHYVMLDRPDALVAIIHDVAEGV